MTIDEDLRGIPGRTPGALEPEAPPNTLVIQSLDHDHLVSQPAPIFSPGEFVNPFIQWDQASVSKILYSIVLREEPIAAFSMDDIVHSHILTDAHISLSSTQFVLDDPDSIEVGAGWETVV